MPVFLDRAEIKREAEALIHTAKVPPLRFTALFFAICLVLDEISAAVAYQFENSVHLAPFGTLSLSFSFVDILVTLLSSVLLAGYVSYCLSVHRGAAMPYDSLFDAFPFAGKVVLLEVLQGLMIGCGTLLFIVPGIVLALTYAFALYHLCEDPEIGVFEALRRSRLETRGYRTQYLVLLLSFLPLFFLAALPLCLFDYFLADRFPDTLAGTLLYSLLTGVLAACVELYLLPYLELSQIGFYRRATADVPSATDGSDEGRDAL